MEGSQQSEPAADGRTTYQVLRTVKVPRSALEPDDESGRKVTVLVECGEFTADSAQAARAAAFVKLGVDEAELVATPARSWVKKTRRLNRRGSED